MTPDFRLHCKHCGNAFVEMKDLLFHPCQQPARPKPKRTVKKGRRNRAGVARARAVSSIRSKPIIGEPCRPLRRSTHNNPPGSRRVASKRTPKRRIPRRKKGETRS